MSNPKSTLLGAAMLCGIILFAAYGVTTSVASGRYEREYGEGEHKYRDHEVERQLPDHVAANTYREECGSCHMAYPPRLLPTQSWQALMKNLDDHFGDNAETDPETTSQVEEFLVEISRSAGYRRMARNPGQEFPLRITELPYFRHEHDEIPREWLRGNDKVTSLSQCNVCHRQAERGWFDEDDIHIPGFGRWHD